MTPDARDVTTPPRMPAIVEYSPAVLDQIRDLVNRALYDDTRGAMETGGVLFGNIAGRHVSVRAVRKIPRDNGAALFVPDEQSSRAIERILAARDSQIRLRGLIPVGWFVSHARDSLALRRTDVEIFDRYFKEDWQVTTVVRPGRTGRLHAATYVRTGTAAGSSMLNTLDLEPGDEGGIGVPESSGAAVEEALDEGPATGEISGPLRQLAFSTGARAAGAAAGERTMVTAAPEEVTAPIASAHRAAGRWLPWLLAGILAVLLAAVGMVYFNAAGNTGLGLQAVEREGVTQIEWDGDSRAASHAKSGKLEIVDGAGRRAHDLSPAELKRGVFSMIRRGSDLTAKLTVVNAVGRKTEELARYVGKAAPTAEDPRLTLIRDLQAQNEALRQELAKERDRANELQSWAEVLESSLKKREGRK